MMIFMFRRQISTPIPTITSFDGEGAITSAIDYVVNEEQPKIYLLEGHGERELPASFKEQIEKEISS